MYFLRIGHPILPTGYINTFSRFYNYRKKNLMHRKFSFIFFRECFSQTTEIFINIETSSVFPFVVSNVLRTNLIFSCFVITGAAEGAGLSTHSFEEYKSKKENNKITLNVLSSS